MATILIVEDEKPINELIRRSLQTVGHRCVSVYDGQAAVDELARNEYDLLLLDIMLPELGGYEVFEKNTRTPTIFLIARDGLSERVKGLTMGADDYMIKPFEMLELLARVDAVLRRTMKASANESFELDGVRIDFGSRIIYCDHQSVEYTPKRIRAIGGAGQKSQHRAFAGKAVRVGLGLRL